MSDPKKEVPKYNAADRFEARLKVASLVLSNVRGMVSDLSNDINKTIRKPQSVKRKKFNKKY